MQKGFIQLTLSGYIIAGLTVALLISAAMLKIQSSRLEACKTEFQVFKSEVERLGLEAQKKKLQIEAQDKLKKEAADNELKKLRLANGDLSKRLRSDTDRSFLPRPEASTGQSEGTCDRDLIDRALRDFAKGTAELIIEGQSAIDSLNNAKRWSQSQ